MNNYFNNNFPNFPNSGNFPYNNGGPQFANTGSIPPYPPSSYTNSNMPPYPGDGNFAPNPIGFAGFENNQSRQMPPYPSQYPQQFPSNSFNMPNNDFSSNINDGFPIAPPNSNFSPPSSFNTQPDFRPNYQNVPPPSSFNTQPDFRPNYPNVPPPSSFNTQPDFRQNYPNVPPPPIYASQNEQAPFQGSPNPNQLYQTSHSGSNLFPNLNQNNFNQSLIQLNPTLRPFQPFNPAHDAEQLYKAMKGFGTDEAKLIDVLCKRTFAQRDEISRVFKTSYGKDLLKNIESETSGNFRQVLVALLQRPMVVESIHLRESVAGLGTDEHALIDVVCTKTNAEMMELRQTYFQMYRRNLEDDVKDDVSGYFKRFLVSLINAHRSEAPADYQKAVAQAKELYNAGERKLGTNEVVFNRIIGAESHAHLRLVFDEYQKLTGHSIEQAIRSEMSTSVQRAFLTTIQYIRKPAAYYAQRLNESMKGLGTKDKLLIRMVVLRSEIDMMDIKVEFQRMYRKSLESFIKSDCSGDYKRALLCLVGDPNWK